MRGESYLAMIEAAFECPDLPQDENDRWVWDEPAQRLCVSDIYSMYQSISPSFCRHPLSSFIFSLSSFLSLLSL